jgi:hypothetical protein
MSAHAACSPSSATMWLACPASVTKTAGMTRPSSRFAREGTAAHMVAEMSLKGDIFLPDKVEVEGDEYIVSRGMCQALNPYVTYVQNLMTLPGARAFLEQRLVVPHTYKMVWGTMDCGVRADGFGLFVADLKFGKGHFVEADTPQLKLYALGFANMIAAKDPKIPVWMTICQPRVGDTPLRTHVMTLGELWEWSYSKVRPAIERIKWGDQTENAGPHCRWCVRKTACAAHARKHQTQAASAFDDEIF